jgi:hypothetical protein
VIIITGKKLSVWVKREVEMGDNILGLTACSKNNRLKIKLPDIPDLRGR